MKTFSYLLILACSKRKREHLTSAPAIELYDGPAFRMLRKYLATNNPSVNLKIIIFSAKYGFISANNKIKPYEQRFTKNISDKKKQLHLEQLIYIIKKEHFKQVFINLGSDYLRAIPDLNVLFTGDPDIIYAEGRIGEKLHQMKLWLQSIHPTNGS